MGMPLLLVRDHEGEIGLFQNTCRHRGMILVHEATHIRRVIRCPYHSWCYDLKGELKATPHVGGPGRNSHEAIRLDDLGLVRIRAGEFLGVVFANISGNAPSFDQSIAQLKSRWADFDQDVFCGTDSSSTLNVRTNWKLAVENYCESYHLPWIHPGLNAYSKLADHYNIDDRPGYSGQGTRVYRQLGVEGGIRFPDFDGISDAWNTAGEYVSLFPNVLLGVHRDHCFAMVLEPVRIDHTVEHLRLFYTEEAASEERFAPLRRENLNLWSVVFNEDISVVEGMQRGRQGIYFDGGHFSPVMDASTAVFHRWVAQTLDAACSPEPIRTEALIDARPR
jgi:phenylpropionate dioxygenase-like ring-hydroxylating dioxygenase large terminal subunit